MSTLNNPSKHGPQRSGMTHQAWRKAQTVTHKSAARYFFGPRAVSKDWPNGCTGTYNIGRNAAKRERTALLVQIRRERIQFEAEMNALYRACITEARTI